MLPDDSYRLLFSVLDFVSIALFLLGRTVSTEESKNLTNGTSAVFSSESEILFKSNEEKI